jgi:hypothetical protein
VIDLTAMLHARLHPTLHATSIGTEITFWQRDSLTLPGVD